MAQRDDSETEYVSKQLVRAQHAARSAEAEVGELRGTIAEMKTQLARARQDQESFQTMLDIKRGVQDRFSSLTDRLRSRLRRA